LVKLTLFAPLLFSDTAPVNTLAEPKVIAKAPVLKLEVPGTVNTPACVMAPLAIMVKLFPSVEAAKDKA